MTGRSATAGLTAPLIHRCGECAPNHGGKLVQSHPCEGVGCTRGANYGIPAEGKKRCVAVRQAPSALLLLPPPQSRPTGSPSPSRWCSGCAKPHVGAEDLGNKRCELCKKKTCTFGMREDRVRRWCAGRARGGGGGGGAGQPRAADRCAPCGKPRGAVVIVRNTCEECSVKKATYGLASDGKKRWCAGCAKAKPNATDLVRARPRARARPVEGLVERVLTGPMHPGLTSRTRAGGR
jgi:hypothetical protein